MIYYQVLVEDRLTGDQVVVLAMATRQEAVSFITKFSSFVACCNFYMREETITNG